MRIGIYGGTFSPVHNGHVIMAKSFLEQIKLDKLYVIPTFTPPHKSADYGISPWDRFEMLKLAFNDCEKIEVSDIEIKRRNISYTVDTLRELQGEGELYLLCGSDMFLTLESWREAREIFRLANIVLGRRENSDFVGEDIKLHKKMFEESYGARIYEISFPFVEISSSEIRKLISEGKSVKEFLPECVENYISEHSLYREATDEKALDEIRNYVSSKISPYRLNHTLGVEKEICRLGEIFLPDKIYKLRVAALLHDITKEYGPKQQMELCKAYELGIDNDLEKSPKLFHALTGAYVAKTFFGDTIDSEIFEAILCHTTGRAGMTMFDKLLYLADYIEEGRSFADCVRLRNYFYNGISSCDDKYTHLLKTLLISFDMTVKNITEEGGYVASPTLEAMKYIEEELEEKLGRKLCTEDYNVKEE